MPQHAKTAARREREKGKERLHCIALHCRFPEVGMHVFICYTKPQGHSIQ